LKHPFFDFEIDVFEPTEGDKIFTPHVNFRLVQLTKFYDCRTNFEIEAKIDELIKQATELGKTVKKKLRNANIRHDAILKKMRQS